MFFSLVPLSCTTGGAGKMDSKFVHVFCTGFLYVYNGGEGKRGDFDEKKPAARGVILYNVPKCKMQNAKIAKEAQRTQRKLVKLTSLCTNVSSPVITTCRRARREIAKLFWWLGKISLRPLRLLSVLCGKILSPFLRTGRIPRRRGARTELNYFSDEGTNRFHPGL